MIKIADTSFKLSFETQSFKPKKSNKNCLDCLERALFNLFFCLFVILKSHQRSKKSVQKEKRDLEKEKIKSLSDAWKGYLKAWDH